MSVIDQDGCTVVECRGAFADGTWPRDAIDINGSSAKFEIVFEQKNEEKEEKDEKDEKSDVASWGFKCSVDALVPEPMDEVDWIFNLESTVSYLCGKLAGNLVCNASKSKPNSSLVYWAETKLFSMGFSINDTEESKSDTIIFGSGEGVELLRDLFEVNERGLQVAEKMSKYIPEERMLSVHGGNELNRAINAIIVALIKHNDLTAHLIAFANDKSEESPSDDLLNIWKHVQKVRRWAIQQKQDAPGATYETICAGLIERSIFLLRLHAAEATFSPPPLLRRQSSLRNKPGRWARVVTMMKAVRKLKALNKFHKLLLHKDETAKSTTDLILSFVQASVNLSKLEELLKERMENARLRRLGFRSLAELYSVVESYELRLELLNGYVHSTSAVQFVGSHYLKDLGGCGELLETDVREAFGGFFGQMMDCASAVVDPSNQNACWTKLIGLSLLGFDFRPHDSTWLEESGILKLLHSILLKDESILGPRPSKEELASVYDTELAIPARKIAMSILFSFSILALAFPVDHTDPSQNQDKPFVFQENILELVLQELERMSGSESSTIANLVSDLVSTDISRQRQQLIGSNVAVQLNRSDALQVGHRLELEKAFSLGMWIHIRKFGDSHIVSMAESESKVNISVDVTADGTLSIHCNCGVIAELKAENKIKIDQWENVVVVIKQISEEEELKEGEEATPLQVIDTVWFHLYINGSLVTREKQEGNLCFDAGLWTVGEFDIESESVFDGFVSDLFITSTDLIGSSISSIASNVEAVQKINLPPLVSTFGAERLEYLFMIYNCCENTEGLGARYMSRPRSLSLLSQIISNSTQREVLQALFILRKVLPFQDPNLLGPNLPLLSSIVSVIGRWNIGLLMDTTLPSASMAFMMASECVVLLRLLLSCNLWKEKVSSLLESGLESLPNTLVSLERLNADKNLLSIPPDLQFELEKGVSALAVLGGHIDSVRLGSSVVVSTKPSGVNVSEGDQGQVVALSANNLVEVLFESSEQPITIPLGSLQGVAEVQLNETHEWFALRCLPLLERLFSIKINETKSQLTCLIEKLQSAGLKAVGGATFMQSEAARKELLESGLFKTLISSACNANPISGVSDVPELEQLASQLSSMEFQRGSQIQSISQSGSVMNDSIEYCEFNVSNVAKPQKPKIESYSGGLTSSHSHGGVTCDECRMYPIQGVRWKCVECYDYDLCDNCYNNGLHNMDHTFNAIIDSSTPHMLQPSRNSIKQRMDEESKVRSPFSPVRLTQGGTITCSGENASSNEGRDRAFDGITTTKWLDVSSLGTGRSWIAYKYPENQQHRVVRYDVTSANDCPHRDPTAWRLLGRKNGEEWVEIDTQSGVHFSNRHQTLEFVIKPGCANFFNEYKFEFTAMADASRGDSYIQVFII